VFIVQPNVDDFPASIGAIKTTEGPDIASIHVDGKFRNWLNEEQVLPLRSPPGSGKTTFAVTFTAYLLSTGFKATYLNASLSQNTPSNTRSMDSIWRAAFESGSTFPETALECPSVRFIMWHRRPCKHE